MVLTGRDGVGSATWGGEASRKKDVSQQPRQRPLEPERIGVMTNANSSHPQVYSLSFLPLVANSAIKKTGLSFYPIFQPSTLALNPQPSLLMENEIIIFHCL